MGVSQYEHSGWNLNFADRDAEKLFEFIQTPAGGAFESDKILSLINELATTANITKGLRSFLKQPGRDDIVLLYFACHGAPDPDRPENIYLLTHDADPADISGTALPMREIQLALTETLHAERVVMLADTCHSGKLGAGPERRLATTEAGVMNKYLEELSEARGGVALLTSAEANETSQEGKEWGGGHGVFTHFLLEGMRGAADGYAGRPRDGKVTVRELFEYVRDSVKSATKVQHPVIGPHVFDESLPIAITGEINAREYCQLAEHLEKLAQLLGEPERFRAAAEQFREASELAKAVGSGVREAELGHARNLLSAGDLAEAVDSLKKLIARDKIELVPQARFLLGIAEAKQHRYEEATSAFQAFLRASPQDENAAWVRSYISWIKTRTSGRKIALLIGINKYQLGHVPPLAGCINDVQLVKEMLIGRGGFDASNISQLCDEQATRQNILASLKSLSTQLNPEDHVWLSYSGHSIPESNREVFGITPSEDLYLVVHDTIEKSGKLVNGISPEELHQALKELPAKQKTLVLDTHPSRSFNQFVQSDGDYVLLLGSDSAELSSETQVEINGSFRPAGLFTAALATFLSGVDSQLVTYGEVIDSALGYIRDRDLKQTPLLLGDRGRPVFVSEDIFLGAFEFAKRRNYTAISPDIIEQRYRRFASSLPDPFPEFYYSAGRALTETGRYSAALGPLQTALAQSSGGCAEVAITVMQAHLGAYHDAEADAALRKYLHISSAQTSVTDSALANMELLLTGRPHAFLVGIENYISPHVTPVNGAVNDALLMKKILQEKWQFRNEDIVILLDGEATRSAIFEQFQALCVIAGKEPALFYFAGNGSLGPGFVPTVVSADGRCEGVYDIDISELRALARTTNLVSILDVGWNMNLAPGARGEITGVLREGLRTIPADPRRIPASRGIIGFVVERLRGLDLGIGALTVCSAGALPFSDLDVKTLEVQALPQSKRPPLLKGKVAVHGKLTYALARALIRDWKETPTYREWLNATTDDIGHSYPLKVFGDISDERLFDNFTARDAVAKELKYLEYQPIEESIVILVRQIEQHHRQGDSYPLGWLNLGIAYYAKIDYDKAINALMRAAARYDEESNLSQEQPREQRADKFRCEAHFQLGRALYKRKLNLTRAVDELNKAFACDSENPHVLYNLGQAVREMVEHETLSKAETVLKKYLEKGAPLGHEDEVREFLGSRPGPDLSR